MNKYKAILFDLDGTLLNTLADLGNSMNNVLKRRGFPTHDMNAYRYHVGEGALILVARSLPEEYRSNELMRECLKEFYEEYDRNWKIETAPYEGIPEMLKELGERGIRMSVLSNKPHEFTQRCVAEYFPGCNFDLICGQRDFIPRKPDPAGALEIAKAMNIPVFSFVYMGDTAIDMKTAVSAGMYPVGVLWGFRPAEELLKHGATDLIEHPMEILKFF